MTTAIRAQMTWRCGCACKYKSFSREEVANRRKFSLVSFENFKYKCYAASRNEAEKKVNGIQSIDKKL